MRHGLLAGVVGLVACVLVMGCGGAAVPSPFAVEYPAATAGAKPLPITLIDQTGLASGIVAAPGATAISEVTAVAGQPNVLRVSWAGGACDDRATLVLNRIGARYELAIHNHPPITAGFNCADSAVARAVDITFLQPIEPADLSLNITYP